MKILVLGGTVFLGRHAVESALARGHSVTLFNRGRQNPDLFPKVEKLRGDRDGDLSALGGRRFDAVIDTTTYTPGQASRMAAILDRRIEHYTFISSVSAYAGFPARRSYDETAPLAEGNHGYGPLKARSEEALEAAFPGRVTHLRPGLIAGPHDPTDRFTYWPRRIAQGGEVLAPGRPERPIQFIDARDLADWCVRLSERQCTGYFNAVGPQWLLTMRQFLEACRSTVGGNARFNWVSDEELIAAGAEAWTELPLWIPENDDESGGLFLGDNKRAIAAGLTYRPVVDTIKETLEWDVREGRPPDSPIRVSPISRKQEASILAGRRAGCEMNIRRAQRHEAETLSALALKAKAYWGYSADMIESWRQDLSVSSDTIASRPTFVAAVGGEVAGFYSLVPSNHSWNLDHLWVLPQFMDRGIGRALVAHALETALRGGASSVTVDADPNAESFYLACGADRCGEVPAPIPGQPKRVRPQLTFRGRAT